MKYEFIAIPDKDIPAASDRLFLHLRTTYTSETNKTASLWRAIPDDQLEFRPHEKTNTIRDILVHQILSGAGSSPSSLALRNRQPTNCCHRVNHRRSRPT